MVPENKTGKDAPASPILLLRPPLPPHRGFIPFPWGLLSPVTAQPPADRPQAPAALLLPTSACTEALAPALLMGAEGKSPILAQPGLLEHGLK